MPARHDHARYERIEREVLAARPATSVPPGERQMKAAAAAALARHGIGGYAELGAGKFGVVVLVRARALRHLLQRPRLQMLHRAALQAAITADRKVVVKVQRAHGAYREMRSTARHEAAILSKLASEPGVREYLPAFFAAASEGDLYYIVMEQVVGTPLTHTRATDATWRRLERAVRALHAAGFVHADLHSDNVLVTPEGRVKLVDLGVATFASEAGRARNLRRVDDMRARHARTR